MFFSLASLPKSDQRCFRRPSFPAQVHTCYYVLVFVESLCCLQCNLNSMTVGICGMWSSSREVCMQPGCWKQTFGLSRGRTWGQVPQPVFLHTEKAFKLSAKDGMAYRKDLLSSTYPFPLHVEFFFLYIFFYVMNGGIACANSHKSDNNVWCMREREVQSPHHLIRLMTYFFSV